MNDKDILNIKQTLIDAIKLCDKLGGREDMKRMIQEALEKMDMADDEYKMAMRELKIDELLRDVKSE